jgi:serine phosphatase RsbU (regulator of sigma subunit)
MNEVLAQWSSGEDAPSVPASPVHISSVLLIEDDDEDALIVEDLLASSAMAVQFVRGRSLWEGLAKLSGDVDCVLLDLGLPDAVGLESLRRVRAAAPTVAVIVLTGLDDERAGEAAVTAGAQDYLVKGKVDEDLLARAIRYANGRKHAEQVDRQLYEAETHAAENERLERGLVPHPIVTNPSIWIASSYLPGRRPALLGGDFYDVVETADGCLHVVIGDVSGRGADEAALGAALRIAWRALTLSLKDGDRLLSTLQRVIERERRVPSFATLCTLEIAPWTLRLRMRRAGHPPPLLIDGTSVTALPAEPGGVPLGMFAGAGWPELTLDLPSDWTMLLYTDGLVEGRAGPSGHLEQEGLVHLIAAYLEREPDWRRRPERLLAHLLARAEELNGEELRDDVAMLLVGRHAHVDALLA